MRDRLNDAQWQAASAEHGHLLINAAAGTGKTTTIAARILYLQLVQDVPPSQIMAVTFSRAARAHLARRMEELVDYLHMGSPVRTLTLHGLSYHIIDVARANGETWIPRNAQVIETGRNRVNPLFAEYARELVGRLSDPFAPEDRVQIYARAIDALRQGHPACSDAVIRPEELTESGDIPVAAFHGPPVPVSLHNIRIVWERYERLLRRRRCIDYPGMVAESLRVLYDGEATLGRLRSGLTHIIVDEFQDTSTAHLELVREMAGAGACVTAVGDDDQTIFTFNGSDVRNMTRFTAYIGDTPRPVLPPVALTENYRSTPVILQVANQVLARAAGQNAPKSLEPAREVPEGPVRDYRERNLPVYRVRARKPETSARWVAAEIRRLLSEEQINPAEIAVLVRKDTEHSPQGQGVRDALAELGVAVQTPDRDPDRTVRILQVARQICLLNQELAVQALMQKVAAHEFDSDLEEATPEEVLAALDDARTRGGAKTAYEAAEVLFDRADPDNSPAEGAGVHVRTVHSAKGLEFRVVFLLHLADGDWPTGHDLHDPEEQRLFYVGVTRAQERLYVLGRPGLRGPSLFDWVDTTDGPGVRQIDADAVDRPADPTSDRLDGQTRDAIENARQRQQELEDEWQRRAREEADQE